MGIVMMLLRGRWRGMLRGDFDGDVVFRSNSIGAPHNSIDVRRISTKCPRCTQQFYICTLLFK